MNIDWNEVKQEKYNSDRYETVICYNCKRKLFEGDTYFDVFTVRICEVCIDDFKKYA